MDLFNFGTPIIIACIIFFVIWDMVWKGIALWKSARNNHIAWFVCIILFNTVGILPIVYILLNRSKNL